MITNNKLGKSISLILIFMMVMSTTVSFAQSSIEKEESVYVNLDLEGNPTKKISSVWLHSDNPLGEIEDKTILKDIVNVKGEKNPNIEGDKVIWNTDKRDIFYRGETDKKLPIEVNIKYYLDEKEMNPQDMVGKSGKVKIILEIKNKDSHSVYFKNKGKKTLYTPFVSAVVMNLPLDKFENVKINSGKLICDGNNQVITYISLPGIKESINLNKNIIDIPNYLEINADTEEFEMGPIAITATSEIPEIGDLEEVKSLDDLIDGVQKIKEASEKLNSATMKLYKGQSEFDDGVNKFLLGVDKLNKGSSPLMEGTVKLKEGLNDSYEGSKKVNDGVKSLAQNSSKLGQGFVDYGKGAVEFSGKSKEFSDGAVKVAESVKQIPDKTKEMNKGIDELVKGTERIKNGQDKLTQGLSKSLGALEKIQKGKQKELKVIKLLLNGIDKIEVGTKTMSKIPGISTFAKKITKGLEEEKQGLEGLVKSSNELIAGLDEVKAGIEEAQNASHELSSNIEKVNKGQKDLGLGINKLVKGTGELEGAASQLVEGSNGLALGAKKLDNSSNELNNGANRFASGSKELSVGSESLTQGLGKLNIGAEDLYIGLGTLTSGMKELASKGNELKDGSKQLVDGTKELSQNMNKFYDEGILEMSNQIQNSNLDIDEIIETKDELIKLSQNYDSFTGIKNDMKGSVKFIMKTDELKGEEVEEPLEAKTNVEEKKGFINWIKNLFKRKK